jgi:hypothetical protein
VSPRNPSQESVPLKNLRTSSAGLLAFLSMAAAAAAQPAAPAAAPATDVYHVHFTKAVGGQAAALGKFLATPDPSGSGNFIVLRHQHGDDWDYAVIEHIGAKATVDAAPAAPNAGRDMSAWHTDTFVSGPSWAVFAKAMGVAPGDQTAGSVYTVATWRAAPGHREKLEAELKAAPPSKVPVSQVLMQHLEGGPWQFLTISRHNSWQDFGADQAATAAASGPDGWAAIREHSTFHHDTLADRIAPR